MYLREHHKQSPQNRAKDLARVKKICKENSLTKKFSENSTEKELIQLSKEKTDWWNSSMSTGLEQASFQRRQTNGQKSHGKVSSNTRGVQIKTLVGYHFFPTRTARIKRQKIASIKPDMEKVENSRCIDRNIKLQLP